MAITWIILKKVLRFNFSCQIFLAGCQENPNRLKKKIINTPLSHKCFLWIQNCCKKITIQQWIRWNVTSDSGFREKQIRRCITQPILQHPSLYRLQSLFCSKTRGRTQNNLSRSHSHSFYVLPTDFRAKEVRHSLNCHPLLPASSSMHW